MESIAISLIAIALGLALLLLGKNLPLFAAAAGFLIGFILAQQIVPGQTMTALIAAAILAVIGLVIATTSRRGAQLIFQIMGAVAGAGVLLLLGQLLGIAGGIASWIILFIGALIGFILMARFFKLGIIILTSLLGASLIVYGLGAFVTLPSIVSLLITLGLAVIGFLYQRRGRRRR
ncbi:MAG: hypothetical protein NZM18_05670 [Thermoflexales bacterium]|nr:hypothetical protein [Thermoflexales bacterium]MDW8352410.1 hypothetical protein [Anaerolineae bacterium]